MDQNLVILVGSGSKLFSNPDPVKGSVRSGSGKRSYKSNQPRFNITGPPFSIHRTPYRSRHLFYILVFYIGRRLQTLHCQN